jgi:hypothetical protein
MEQHHPNYNWKKKFNASPSVGKAMATVFWGAEGKVLIDTMPHSQTINSDLYIQTFKILQKHFRRLQPQKMSLRFLFCATTHDHTQAYKQTTKILDGLFFPTDNIVRISLLQIFTSLGYSNVPPRRKSWEC